MAGVTEEVSKQVGGFMEVMRQQPMALALIVMNLTLLGYLFYLNSSVNTQRKDAIDLIIGWQKETDKLMASCVSAEVSRMMLDNMQKITDTMLSAEQKEIQRMQGAINEERQRSWDMRERQMKALEKQQEQQQQQQPPEPKSQNNSFRPNRSLLRFPLPALPPLPPFRAVKFETVHK